MPNKDYAHIISVIDSSGSMVSNRRAVIDSVNSMVKEQQEAPRKFTVSAAVFNSGATWRANFDPSLQLTRENYGPEGRTALHDAIGTAIVSTGESLEAMEEGDRPGLVVLSIFTDGLENASREFSPERIQEMISTQRETYSWHVNFIRMGEQVAMQAVDLGVPQAQAYVSGRSDENARGTYASTSGAVLRARSISQEGGSYDEVVDAVSLTSEEQDSIRD